MSIALLAIAQLLGGNFGAFFPHFLFLFSSNSTANTPETGALEIA